jgi:FSR family fosmidomycin resistance protein-like MFS transporter
MRVKLPLLSVMHLVTDGLCSFLVFSRLYSENPYLAFGIFIAYNILAFVTQSPIGILADKYNKPRLFLAVSAALILLGYVLASLALLSVLCIGIGNALFHVAGGKYVTDKSGNAIDSLGIFVSTGAVGLALGQIYLAFVPLPYIFFALLFGSLILFLVSEDPEDKSHTEEFDHRFNPKIALLAVVGIVFVRSFVGKMVSPAFTLTGGILITLSVFTALGKAMGGIASRLLGIRLTTTLSMCIAAVCLTLGVGNPYTFILGVFFFNFSMPITLYFANVLLKGKEGFAFGTLAAFLAPAYFLAMLSTYSLIAKIVTAVLCILSILIINEISERITNAEISRSSHRSN